MSPRTAVVMNMFYTGLGIARSLGENGIPVVGLSAQRGVCGNFTRYAKVLFAPDSKTQPQELLEHLMGTRTAIPDGSVVFPTRDDDVLFLDRFRAELEQRFVLVIPQAPVIEACLDKWKTYEFALRAGVAAPQSWVVESAEEIASLAGVLRFPCVLKPVAAHEWRRGENWEAVGGRKAIGIAGLEELLAEYATISKAGKRVLIQEMIPGGDEALVIQACYLDRQSDFIAGFNTQKLVQTPENFGTGCIVRSADYPELLNPSLRLLREMRYTGIAEVEYKRDSTDGSYKLIEINPRPWDQHRLGKSCGMDLIYVAYCEHAGLPFPELRKKSAGHRWIAEDAFILGALQSLKCREGRTRSLFRLARGKRVFAIWSWKDPLPFLGYMVLRFFPAVVAMVFGGFCKRLIRSFRTKKGRQSGSGLEMHLERDKSNG